MPSKSALPGGLRSFLDRRAAAKNALALDQLPFDLPYRPPPIHRVGLHRLLQIDAPDLAMERVLLLQDMWRP